MKAIARLLGSALLFAALLGLSAPVAGHAAKSTPRARSGKTAAPSAGWALPDAATVASVVGVTPATLLQDLAAGQTVLQIAGSKFSSANALAVALAAPMKLKIDTAISGGMPKGKTDTANADYTQAVAAYAQLVVMKHPPLEQAQSKGSKTGGSKTGASSGNGSDNALYRVMATQCHTTLAAFTSALATGGRSPLAICRSTNAGVSQSTLVSALVQATIQDIGGAVTSDDRAGIVQKITTWLTTPISTGNGSKGR